MPDAPSSLAELGENAVLRRLLRLLRPTEAGVVGPGDDCAVVPRDACWDTLLKTDVVVESVHFLRETEPRLIGRKALARPLSDIAAMGGLPEHALVTLLVHSSRPVSLLEDIYRGMEELAQAYEVHLIGGETSSLPVDGLVINVALTGRVEKGCAVLRSGGKPGDALFVSGRLGGSFPSQRHLSFEPRVALARALLAAGLRPRAMMDLSDGLATDLPRLAGASGCGYELFPERLPLHPGCGVQQALGDGEDYELLFALSPEQALRAEREFESPVVLTRIGTLTAESCSTLGGGWQHFRNR